MLFLIGCAPYPDIKYSPAGIARYSVDKVASGGVGEQSDLPALMFLTLPTTVSEGKSDSGGLRVEHVQFISAALESLLTRPPSGPSSWDCLEYLVFATSVFDAWSRLVDTHGKNPPQSEGNRIIAVSTIM